MLTPQPKGRHKQHFLSSQAPPTPNGVTLAGPVPAQAPTVQSHLHAIHTQDERTERALRVSLRIRFRTHLKLFQTEASASTYFFVVSDGWTPHYRSDGASHRPGSDTASLGLASFPPGSLEGTAMRNTTFPVLGSLLRCLLTSPRRRHLRSKQSTSLVAWGDPCSYITAAVIRQTGSRESSRWCSDSGDVSSLDCGWKGLTLPRDPRGAPGCSFTFYNRRKVGATGALTTIQVGKHF